MTCLLGYRGGRAVSLEAEPDASIQSLKQRAQSALGVGNGRLLTSRGDVVDVPGGRNEP